MSKDEVSKELDMSYSELCQYLVDKYGPAQYDYFVNETCRSKNKKVSRSSEGLECHHMDEDKAIMLSSPKFAQSCPYEYQKAERLVYCNVLEHLILHIKICTEPMNKKAIGRPGYGGALSIVLKTNQFFSGVEFKSEYNKKAYSIIANNFNEYINILKYWIDGADLFSMITPEKLSYDFDGKFVDKVHNALIH
jgi:hypothetical protein